MDAQKVIQNAEQERERKHELLRPVAEWFHSHEGEMFERYEAVDEIIQDIEEISEDEERIVHQVIANLATDRVDPVQNTVQDGKKYVGVIEYTEHDYWYEYVEAHDTHGRVNVGICAQCVKDAESDAEVAKGSGTTEELAQRIEDHYREEHTESPEEVETGATLVSGTTVAGNSLITSANDGVGSGLDADTARGIDLSGLVKQNTSYSMTESGGQVKFE